MKLNLGSGKVIFPWSAEKETARHPMLSIPASACDVDWRNVDGLALAGVDEVVDLFAYPWPWADDSVDEIWCSHIIEHIPHVPRMASISYSGGTDWDEARWQKYCRWNVLEKLDGFYAFFAEVWRVLKPDGVIGIECPYAFSTGAVQDPQHTRQIHEQTFHYLANGDSPTYDYGLPFRFASDKPAMLTINPPFDRLPSEQLNMALATQWNVARNIRIDLKAVK